jgi:hypothetical protein
MRELAAAAAEKTFRDHPTGREQRKKCLNTSESFSRETPHAKFFPRKNLLNQA